MDAQFPGLGIRRGNNFFPARTYLKNKVGSILRIPAAHNGGRPRANAGSKDLGTSESAGLLV